jgi:hypothetical protein
MNRDLTILRDRRTARSFESGFGGEGRRHRNANSGDNGIVYRFCNFSVSRTSRAEPHSAAPLARAVVDHFTRRPADSPS